MRALALTILVVLAPAVLAVQTAPDVAPPTVTAAPASDAAWARDVVRHLPRATLVNDHDGNKLFDSLDKLYASDPTVAQDVVVLFVHGTDADAAVAAAQDLVGQFPVHRTFTVVPAASVTLTLDQALRVAALDAVRQLEWNRPGTHELETATVFFGADQVVDDLGVTGDRDGDATTYTPEDVTIAILDTGIDGGHVDLDDGKVVHFLDLGDGETDAYDAGSHGTHVASIAAGTGDGDAAYRGVAPGAGIVGIKIIDVADQPFPVSMVLGDTKSSYDLAIAGYEWIVQHKDAYGIDVSTMSFGFGIATDGTTALELAVDAAWDAGIVNFKSTGNSGPGRSTMTVPAAARGIIAVGAMLDPAGTNGGLLGVPGSETAFDPSFGMSLATFSSRGPTADGRVKPDVVAPGYSITAAYAGTGDGYATFSGTSMASPFAAGTAALVLDANPGLVPDVVREVLLTTAEDWGVAGPDIDYGWGRLQTAAAVAEAARRAGTSPDAPVTTPVVPFHEVRAGVFSAAGRAMVKVEVNDTTHPLAATIITEGVLLGGTVLGPDGAELAETVVNQGRRQATMSIGATVEGMYTLVLAGVPGHAFVVDLSHGAAGGLPIDLDVPLPLDDADADLQNTVPVPGALLVAGLLVAGLTRRRR